jgi:hypothetical protein
MITLSVGGHAVTVDDSFLKLSPEQQQAKVNDIAVGLAAGLMNGNSEASKKPSRRLVWERL